MCNKEKMNKDLNCINNWAVQWQVSINATKTFSMLFMTKSPRPIPLLYGSTDPIIIYVVWGFAYQMSIFDNNISVFCLP